MDRQLTSVEMALLRSHPIYLTSLQLSVVPGVEEEVPKFS